MASQQVNQAVDQGMRPVVDELAAIRVPQDYLTRRDSLRRERQSERADAADSERQDAGRQQQSHAEAAGRSEECTTACTPKW